MKTPKDPRSTQRKRARKVLFKSGRPYVCEGYIKYDFENEISTKVICGKSPKSLPPDAPKDLELAPVELRTVTGLQADHENKNIMDNDLANLSWKCPSCHKISDSQTGKLVSTKGDEFNYGLDELGL